MKRSLSAFILVTAMLPAPLWAQSKYAATPSSTNLAIAKGEAREALAAMEAQGLEAEKNAASSPSPQTLSGRGCECLREAAGRQSWVNSKRSSLTLVKPWRWGKGEQSGAPNRANIYFAGLHPWAIMPRRWEWGRQGIEVTQQIPEKAPGVSARPAS